MPQNAQSSIAIYSATSRGRVQLIYGGQPFIFEKSLKLSSGEEKKYWRCNQWWNQKCRSRVCTVNDLVMPLNRYHTHEEIVRRKKRVRKDPTGSAKKSKPDAGSATSTGTPTGNTNNLIDVPDYHIKYEEIVADVTDIGGVTTITMAKAKK